MKRLLAIGFIWFGCAIAWMILGSTLLVRSGESSAALNREVQLLWGPQMEQRPPAAGYKEIRPQRERRTAVNAQGYPVETEVTRDVEVDVPVPLDGTDAKVRLALEHRRKGLLWFATYGVDFRAAYTFTNDTHARRRIFFHFPLAADNAIYDGFQVSDAEGKAVEAEIAGGTATWAAEVGAGERRTYTVAYRSRGTAQWHYLMTAGTGQVRDFRLAMDTDFKGIDFPAGTLSPTRHKTEGYRWSGVWEFSSLVANSPIGVELPQKLNPGPLAARITFFAPVGLLFFFFVVAVLGVARRRNLHPLNYFLLGCAFFAFHLLFAYLVDHLAVFPAFGVSALVSTVLVVSYARLFVGWTFAWREMGISQLLYLVLFSFTFFWQGFTGLAVTVGAIVTLFVMMQITGRARWSALTAEPPKPSPAQATPQTAGAA